MSVMLASVSMAGAPTRSGAETGLIGIKLYDSGSKIVGIFGTPNEVQAVTIGGTGAAGGGGAPGGFGGPPGAPGASGGRAGGGGGKGNGGNGSVATAGYVGPSDDTSFGFGDTLLQGFTPPPQGGPPGGIPGVPPQGGPGRPGGRGPGPVGPGLGGPPGGTPGVPGGGGGSTEKVVFTRWIYNRAGSKYGFVMDKFSRVIQIEAIGIANPRVHTARGIAFGSSFAQIIKKYNRNPDGTANSPDGYEINGDTIVVRYLVKNKVAFRLSRLGKDKPQVVTGIAVAAGKL